MAIYLLKSTAILAIFWTLYVLFLEKENMHRFKRFYLLASIIVAFCIPLLSITEYVYVEPVLDGFNFSNAEIPFILNEDIAIIETPFWTLEHVLWSIYIFGVVLFAIRFIKNIIQLATKIVRNEKEKETPITYVLLKQIIDPHTFFNFIFLNKEKFKTDAVPNSVLLHEKTHAKQKHSLDILFIEILQIIFWFQPFIWLYKKRIKLNHEFLADEAVINNGVAPSNYQNTLLEYSSNQEHCLVNAINYSSIKKRFTVMKTQTSQKKKWLFALLVLPILGVLFYSFSQREIVKVEENVETNAILLVKDNWNLSLNGKETSLETLLPDFKNLKGSAKDELIVDSDYAIDIEFICLIAEKLLIERINISTTERTVVVDKDNVLNKQYNEYKKQASEALMNEYKAFIKKYKETNIIFGDTYERAIVIYDELMSDAQRASVEKYPPRLIPKPNLSKTKPRKLSTTLFNDLKNAEKYAIWIDKKHVSNSELNNYTAEDFVHYTGSKVYKNARSKKFPQPNQYRLFTKTGFKTTYQDSQLSRYNKAAKQYTDAIKLYIKGPQTDNSELKILYSKANAIYKTFSADEIEKHTIKIPPPVPAKYKTPRNSNQQNPPTAKEVAEYNAWAKKLNEKELAANSSKYSYSPIIKKKNLDKYKSIYDRMSPEQLKSAEKFPNLPPLPIAPPPPPTKPKQYKNGKKKTLNEIIKNTRKDAKSGYEVLDNGESHYYIIYKGKKTYYNKDGYVTDDKGNVLPPPPPPAPKKNKSKGGPNASENQKQFEIPKPTAGNIVSHIKVMNRHKATFFIEGKEVTFKEALKYVRNNKDADVTSSSKTNTTRIEPPLTKSKLSYNSDCLDIPKSFITKNSNTLKINCIENYTENKFQVFNRWGNLIYSKENYDNTWDGSVEKTFAEQGTNKPISGTYYYVFSSSKLKEQKAGYLYINPKNYDAIEIKKSKSKGGPNPDDYFTNTYNSDLKNEYIKKYKEYEALRYAKPHFLRKSKADKKRMNNLWMELRQMHIYKLGKTEKKDLKLPITPLAPYVKINLDGKSYYKVRSKLNERELKSTMSLPKSPRITQSEKLLDKTDPIIIPLRSYKLDKTPVSKSNRRIVHITVSEDGKYGISMDDTLKSFKPLALAELEKLVLKLSEEDKENTFVFAQKKDYGKFRSKPSASLEYQNDIEIIIIKDDVRFPVFETNGKFKEVISYKSVLDNKPSNQLKNSVQKLGEVFKKHGIKNITF